MKCEIDTTGATYELDMLGDWRYVTDFAGMAASYGRAVRWHLTPAGRGASPKLARDNARLAARYAIIALCLPKPERSA